LLALNDALIDWWQYQEHKFAEGAIAATSLHNNRNFVIRSMNAILVFTKLP